MEGKQRVINAKGVFVNKQKRASGVSTALLKTIDTLQGSAPLIDTFAKQEYTIKIANTLEEREAAFKLGYSIYLEKGYINKNPDERLICEYDFNEETVILIVQDKQKNIAGSATLVFDGAMELPASKVYHHEIKTAKQSYKRNVEICRFVINSNYRNSKEILVLLFNYAAIYIQKIKKYDGLVIEVTPRHKNYYKELLHFEEIGTEKCCPQVQNTVGVLLHLSTQKYQNTCKGIKTTTHAEKKDRSLYPYFLKAEQEDLVACYLEKQTKTMSAQEKEYFGFSEKKESNSLCAYK